MKRTKKTEPPRDPGGPIGEARGLDGEGMMKPADLGIEDFTPEPDLKARGGPREPPVTASAPAPPPVAASAPDPEAVARLVDAKLDQAEIMELVERANNVTRQNAELLGFLANAQAAGKLLGFENALLRKALAAARLHRAVLLGVALLLLVLLLARS
jgi:hypothetical protein